MIPDPMELTVISPIPAGAVKSEKLIPAGQVVRGARGIKPGKRVEDARPAFTVMLPIEAVKAS